MLPGENGLKSNSRTDAGSLVYADALAQMCCNLEKRQESDVGERRRGRRPAGFCQEQTLVLAEQFSSMERDAFHVAYLSDKILEAVFHGQAVKTVAYLRASTAQQDLRSQRFAILEYARLPHRRLHRGNRLWTGF